MERKVLENFDRFLIIAFLSVFVFLMFYWYKNITQDVKYSHNHNSQPTNDAKRKSKQTLIDSTQPTTKEKYTLRTHAYSNILKISPPKTENFQIKILMFFIFLLKT